MTADLSTLTDFLLARVAEDEKWARQRRDEDFRKHRVSAHRVRLEPDHCERVLARCAAARRIVGRLDKAHEDGGSYAWALDEVLKELASEYAAHPDYREEWKP